MKTAHEQFAEKGWLIVDFSDKEPVLRARKELQEELSSLIGKETALEDYHETIPAEKHTEIQVHMTEFFRKRRFGPRIVASHLRFFQAFIGLDLLVQANPYLRITRPFRKEDNIGYHRDTFYGGSPYELSVLIPFVDLEPESNLQVLSGSHILPESEFPTTQVVNEDASITKGSAKHNLGFLYAPKVMDPLIESRMESYPLRVGQALIFSLSTVHGSVENRGRVSRWSTDIRVLNALAPVNLEARPTYYEPLCESAVTASAKSYLKNNEVVLV